jgi:hypothetical protein
MSRKWLIGLTVMGVLALGGTYVASGGSPTRVESYAVEGPSTIVIEALTGSGAWVRLTDVVESDDEVVVTVRRLSLPFPGTAAGVPIHFVVELDEPLADRVVSDGFGPVLRR